MVMKSPLIIYWVRRDLRLADNPALTAACAASRSLNVPLLPLFILEDYMTAGNPSSQFGYPSRYFLAHVLPEFVQNFSHFALVQGKAVQYLMALATTYELTIFVNDDVYVDFYTQVDKLQQAGITVEVSEDALSVPKETRSQEGRLYSVFTPFKKSVWQKFIQVKPLPEATVPMSPSAASILASLPNQIAPTQETIEAVFSKKRTMMMGGEVIDLNDLTPEPKLADWYCTEAACASSVLSLLKK